jgi:hypothetical protein
MPITQPPWRLRTKNHKFEANVGYIARCHPISKQNNKNKTKIYQFSLPADFIAIILSL